MVVGPNIYGQGSLHTAGKCGNHDQSMLQLLPEYASPSALLVSFI